MRLVHLADLHLGFRQYQRLTPAGINQREADVAGTFNRTIAQILDIKPDVIVVAGDIFHSVRPSNPAILRAFRGFSSLREQLPDTPIIMVAGNHDAPRTVETGCILRLFREIGIHVADAKTELFTFPSRSLAVLAVPFTTSTELKASKPPDGFTYSVQVLHGVLEGMSPAHVSPIDRAANEIRIAELHTEQWSYTALGHHHVYQEVATRAYYSGSIDYTSANPWGDLADERDRRLPGKGFVEHNLQSGAHRFHPVTPSRRLLDLETIDASGMGASEVDAALAARIASARDGIDDHVVRMLIYNIPRHIVRDLDQSLLREYRRRAMHFHLDTRRPDVLKRRSSGDGAPGRRATLPELVAEHLHERVLAPGIDRDVLVTKGLQYLQQAEDAAAASMPVLVS